MSCLFARIPRRAIWPCCAALFLLSGCGAQPPATGAAGASGQGQEKRYKLEGKVISIDHSQQRLVVDHKEIPGFMAAMAMPYPVADSKVLDSVQPGDQITADVVVKDNSVRLDNVVVTGKGEAPQPGSQLLPPGEKVPNFEFVNQDGKRIHLQQYLGKAVLLTFIYTRCPLPEYCPLLTHNFAETEKALARTPALYSKTHLLSISFDPDHDTPQVLRNYARSFLPQPAFSHWEFAVMPKSSRADIARFFNLFIDEQDGQITHSMTTALIAPDGTLQRWYTATDWTPSQVLADLARAVAATS